MSQIISANISCSRTQNIYFCSICNTLLISVQIQTKKTPKPEHQQQTLGKNKQTKPNKNVSVEENSDESTLASSVAL